MLPKRERIQATSAKFQAVFIPLIRYAEVTKSVIPKIRTIILEICIISKEMYNLLMCNLSANGGVITEIIFTAPNIKMAKAGNNLAKSFLPTHKKLINPNKSGNQNSKIL